MVARITYALTGLVAPGPGHTATAASATTVQPTLLAPAHQIPLADADTCIGAMNETSVLQESDFAPYKPKCDVLLINAVAYAPGGTPQARWPVGFRLGDLQKAFQVTGPRQFERGVSTLGTLGVTEPAPACEVALGFERAFGGPHMIAEKLKLEAYAEDANVRPDLRARAVQWAEAQPEFYGENPIGCGREPDAALQLRELVADIERQLGVVAQVQDQAQDQRRPAPQIEALNAPFTGQASYPVVGVGPLARWWLPRRTLAGTHDAAWKAAQWPKSPKDHDYGYWNCAPEDQQMDYPKGGEPVALLNLTPGARTESPVRFTLPEQDLQLLVRLQVGALLFAPMHIDTVIIDLKARTLSIVRRALVSAAIETRKLELGTWAAGTHPNANSDQRASQPSGAQTRGQ